LLGVPPGSVFTVFLGDEVTVAVRTAAGEQKVVGSDLLVAVGRTPNTGYIALDKAGVKLDSRGYVQVNERQHLTIAEGFGPLFGRVPRRAA
jgi:pyruvate/2-oxoglutarate dehydrogenase complex dihydrolipoamide dehydrogenase (E3) component